MQLRNGFGLVKSLHPHYAGLELGYFVIRIERIDGQHIRGSLFKVKGEEHTNGWPQTTCGSQPISQHSCLLSNLLQLA
jgi:hypothetical protein